MAFQPRELSYDLINIAESPTVCEEYKKLIESGDFTEDTNPQNHLCVYFVPFDPADRTFYLTHNMKVNLYLFPGGHPDKGESCPEAVVREINEELGVILDLDQVPAPFALTKTKCLNPKRSCVYHYNLWYLIKINKKEIIIPGEEVREVLWLPINNIKPLVTDPATVFAINKLSSIIA